MASLVGSLTPFPLAFLDTEFRLNEICYSHCTIEQFLLPCPHLGSCPHKISLAGWARLDRCHQAVAGKYANGSVVLSLLSFSISILLLKLKHTDLRFTDVKKER
ncbi:hypothetical protein LY78DRAFT_289230 [Colletotrichum sublineola]|nr:hypothetical protein LY78DRAFT_289230 [Colletotrichum sublineola]